MSFLIVFFKTILDLLIVKLSLFEDRSNFWKRAWLVPWYYRTIVYLTRGSISPWINWEKHIFLAKLDFIHQHSLLQKQHNQSSASLTFQYLSCRTIYLWPRNKRSFRWWLPRWNRISFLRAFFWGLQTGSSRWGPYPVNMVGAEAIRSSIHSISSW